jgi:hypothetical protein
MYKITLDNGEVRECELSPEQVKWIEDGINMLFPIPLFSTTFAGKKYGNCEMGKIISITKI